MNPGKLKHRICVQRLENTKDEYGEVKGQWVDVITLWANINPIVGKEFFAAETVNSSVTHKVNIRYNPNLTPDMRIKFKNRMFNIISIINFQERNAEIQLMCKELI